MLDAEAPVSCPLELSCASTQGTGSSLRPAGVTRPKCVSLVTTACGTSVAGASANTNVLALVPTSCGRGWKVAWMLDTVGVMLPVTSIWNTGGTLVTSAVK